MGLDPGLIALMNDTIVIEHWDGVTRNGNGEPQLGSPVTVQCYLYRAEVKIINTDGTERMSEAQAILATPELEVTVEDLVTLADGRKRSIGQVLSAKDELGEPYYLEVRV